MRFLLMFLLLCSCSAPFEGMVDSYPLRIPLPQKESGFEPLPMGPLSLDQCFQIALQKNRLLKIAQSKSHLVKSRANQLMGSLLLPHIKLQGTYDMRNNDPGITTSTFSFKTGKRQRGNLDLSLQVPIYGFGKSWNAYYGALLTAKGEELQARRVRAQLFFLVSQGYYGLLSARKEVMVVKKSIDLLREQLRQSRAFYSQGMITKDDVLTLEAEVSRREANLLRSKNQVILIRTSLNLAMGLPVRRETEIKKVETLPLLEGELLDWMARGTRNRSDLKALRTRVLALQKEYKSLVGNLFPTLGLRGDFLYTTDDTALNQNWLNLTLGFEWTLFNGGSTYAKLSQKKEEIVMALRIYGQKADEIQVEIQRDYLLCLELKKDLEVAKKNEKRAGESLRIVRGKYGQGLSTSVDVLRQETALTGAKIQYFRSLYQFYIARARLNFHTERKKP